MKYLYLFRSFVIFFLLLIFSVNNIQAQNAADPDTTIGLGTFNGTIYATEVQADGKILVAGDFTYYKTTAINRLARLNADGTLDNTFNIGTGFNSKVNSIAIQADGKIIIGGYFTSFNGVSENHLARLNIDGTLDNTFNIGTGANNTINYTVFSIAIQSDGKIIIGGGFTSFNGVSKNNLVRLNVDGSIDNTFDTGTGTNLGVYSIAIQPDGKIIIGGYFNYFNGVSLNKLARLNTDGTLDNTFNIGMGANSDVYSIDIQSDGKIIIGGNFTSFNGVLNKWVTRINTDGSLDNTFNTGTGWSNGAIYSVVIQADEKIIIGGDFTSFNGIANTSLARLNVDGSTDNTFNVGTGANNYVRSTVIQVDGKIIIGGIFHSFNGAIINRLARLNVDGSIDNTFNIGKGANSDVYSIAIQTDGKIVIGGAFTSFNGVSINYLVRLNVDGSIDNTFNIGSGPNSTVASIAIQTDGKIIIGGAFTSFNGVSANYLARLNTDGTLDNTFNIAWGAGNSVQSIAIQSDGKIIIGGLFNKCVKRFNVDGSTDNTFNIVGTGFSSTVYSIVIQSNGKIIIGGYFTFFNGLVKNYLARLNVDGSLDNSFSGTTPNSGINTIAIQADGKIIIGGWFTSFNGNSKNYLARLNADGTLDNTFNIGTGVAGYSVYSIAIQSDGKIIVGGNFTSFNGVNKNNLARLNVDGSIDNTFNVGTGANNNVRSVAIQPDGKIIVGGGSFYLYNGGSYNGIVRLRGDPLYLNSIRGNIYTENNNDCISQLSETRLPSVVVKALPGPYYGGSDVYGHYILRVDSGTVNYVLTQEYNSINSKLLINQCATSHNLSLKGAAKDTVSFDFADSIRQCPLLNINVEKSRMRRCFKSNTYINYCNYGNASASGTQIRVVYPSYIKPLSSVPMWYSKQDSVLIYDIGTISPEFCGSINIIDSVVCGDESIRGLTQCIKASISPASNCVAENPAWDRSSMMVTGSCVNNNAVFVIKNHGNGNMSDSLEFRVFVNDTLIFIGNYKLNSSDSLIITYPAAGQTIRLEADQHPLHPGKSRPRATIENCGVATPEVRNLVITSPQDDLYEEVAITCSTIRDSYDPNDKLAMPIGIGATNMIAPGTELEYTIRFQNTGNDTAYTIRVIDTLDVNLDEASFTQGASSHPYTLNISGKGQAVLAFNFYNINLPDSTTNKLGSNGLVTFRVTVPSNTVLGTQIKNKAHIFFDYNSTIITNETMHTVDNTVYSDLSRGSMVQVGQVISGINKGYNKSSVKIYPNPSAGIVTVEIPESKNNSELRIISITGVLQKSVRLNNTSVQQVNLEGISQGMYLYEIWQEGERKAGGMLQVR